MKLIPPSQQTGLPLLSSDHPENALPLVARHRINRVIVESHRYTYEAIDYLEQRDIDVSSDEGDLLLREARFKEAKEILSAYRKEFSRLHLPDRDYRKLMEQTIDGISSSARVSSTQERLFQTMFFLPEEQPQRPEALEPKDALPHSADFRRITFRDRDRRLTKTQAIQVQMLHSAWIDGKRMVSKQDLCNAMGASGSEPRSAWKSKNSDLWTTLIQNDKCGSYWLGID